MKKLLIISALFGAMLFTSCEDFLDVNYTQDSPISTSVDQVLPVATFYAAQLCYDHAEYGVYLCQALTTTSKSQTGSYPYSQGWEFLGVNRHPMWRRHFYDLGANILWIIEKAREFQKNSYFCFLDYAKAFDCMDHNKLWKILKEMVIPATLPAS